MRILSYFHTFRLSHLFTFILFHFLTFSLGYSMVGQVLITDGGTPQLREMVGNNLTEVINALGSGDLTTCQDAFTNAGYQTITTLLSKVKMENAMRTKETKLLTLPAGGWEVRDIKVKVEMGETADNKVAIASNPYQYLVFQLTLQGLIEDVRFAIEKPHWDAIVEQGQKLNDFARRQQILQTVEVFRTAYCEKDLDYLKKIYSDDALIIVGKVLKQKKDLPDYLVRSTLSRDKIEFIKLSKQKYISGLDKVFTRNAFVKVVFDSLEIIRHEKDNDLYGVTLKQNWYSSTYSDTGWVFLLWDFKDEKNPLIYVRSWQPERFKDGSVIDVHEFIIAR